jgi:TonB family protein
MRAINCLRLAAAMWLVSGQAGAQEASRPEPAGDPASWITPSDYPPAALRSGAEGRVVAELGVDATGRVTSCRVQSSSANPALDTATCAVATTRGRFEPARDGDGRAIASTYAFPVRWSLPKGPEPIEVTAPGVRVNMDMAVELRLDGDGKVLSCKSLSAVFPGPAAMSIDPCERYAVGRVGGPPTRRAGKPVGSRVVERTTRQVTLDP